MIFEWYWFPIFYAIILHFRWMAMSVYVHRAWIHGSIQITSKAFCTFMRWYLWITGWFWPGWRRNHKILHTYHHLNSDCPEDPHDPRRVTLKDLANVYDVKPGSPYYVPPEHADKYKDIKNFEDKLEDFFNKYPYQGPAILHLITLALYGPLAAVLAIPIYWVWEKYGMYWIGLMWTHGVGTIKWIEYHSPFYNYEINRKAINYFPFGLFHSGEELHSNHHCRPGSAKFSHRWWEFDIGWYYVKLFQACGWLKVLRIHNDNFEKDGVAYKIVGQVDPDLPK